MRYELIRLVLLQRDRELFSPVVPPTREEWLRRIFGVEIVFDHYGNEFHYVPESHAPAPLVAGRIGRPRPVVENEPPEEGLQEIERESWIAAGIIIDPRTHDDGQKVAIEENRWVGRPGSIFNSLVAKLNERTEEPYVMEANPIVDPETFWEFVRENRGEITSVTFDLFAPNMFGLRSELDRELRELKEKEHVRKAELTLENKDGLELDTDRVRETVGYALEGGGAVRAKTKRKKRYSSKNKKKKVTVEEAKGTFLERTRTAIGSLFGAT
jgi:hypothetical protein